MWLDKDQVILDKVKELKLLAHENSMFGLENLMRKYVRALEKRKAGADLP